MLGNLDLKERIRALARSRRTSLDDPLSARPDAEQRPPRRSRSRASRSSEGGEWRGVHGTVFVHERCARRSSGRGHWGHLGEPPVGEIELASLAAAGLSRAVPRPRDGRAHREPVFWRGRCTGTDRTSWCTSILRGTTARRLRSSGGALAREFQFLITFNGKSYDVPF
jgi:hypothetical protein